MGARALEKLAELQSRHPLIGSVRGAGLLIGVELVRDRATRERGAGPGQRAPRSVCGSLPPHTPLLFLSLLVCAVAPFCSPALEEGEAVLYAALTRGLSFKMTMGNIVTLVPPLIVTQEQMDTAIDILDDALSEVEAAFGYT